MEQRPAVPKEPVATRRDLATGSSQAYGDLDMDEADILFQEAFGARLFRRGKPRAALEVKSADTPLGIP
jgi:hypothetical protein